ncbi:hypothetical protein ElyMa_004338900 [Elysia marginata]|uniref:Uncharacterized protein n=1 Tax=Elysia marginata TaxID=1093978 RepID=A0AAV4H2W1_9GAST|nr:hypothetical protein ElyMa_004338900 [Elysia marginata]
MKVFPVALCGVLVASLALAEEICQAPQATGIGYMLDYEQHVHIVEDYNTTGRLLLSPAGDIHGEPWWIIEMTEKRMYRKEQGKTCTYQELNDDEMEVRRM